MAIFHFYLSKVSRFFWLLVHYLGDISSKIFANVGTLLDMLIQLNDLITEIVLWMTFQIRSFFLFVFILTYSSHFLHTTSIKPTL